MEEIEKTRKEQINALENMFGWANIFVVLVSICVGSGLFSVYFIIYLLIPEIVFALCGIIYNIIDCFKLRKKFYKLIGEQKKDRKENKK